MNTSRYTVITYIIGNYEKVHEIRERSDRAAYLLITDRPDLKSDTWQVVYDATLTGSPMNKVMDIRWHPWRYTSDEIVITLDGSLGVNKSLDMLVDALLFNYCELGIVIHPHRRTILDELDVWASFRNYQGKEWQLRKLSAVGYDSKYYRGLYQTGLMIRRRTDAINEWHNEVLMNLSSNGEYDRLDQTIASAMLNRFHSDMRVAWFSELLLESQFITWYGHGTDDVVHQPQVIAPYAFDHPVEVIL